MLPLICSKIACRNMRSLYKAQKVIYINNQYYSQRTKSIMMNHKSITSSITCTRNFSTNIDFSALKVTKTAQPREMPPLTQDLEFGLHFSDHMLDIDWDATTGWSTPTIHPFKDFNLNPASSVFHYGLALFEGLKAYKDADGNIRMFRPNMNIKRMQSSCAALDFPIPDGDQFLNCLQELLRVDEAWIPSLKGYSLYIRPVMIATTPQIRVMPASNVKLYVITCPVGPYFSGDVSLYASSKYIRAWPGGVGAYKLGGNYGPTMLPQKLAAKEGYSQILWLFPDQKNRGQLNVGEVGAMNLFFYWKNASTGRKELITAPLDGTILPGVTRDSILKLAREWNEFDVCDDRDYSIDEVLIALDEGRIIECFGAGTAAIVCPVMGIGYEGKRYSIPLDADDSSAKSGPLAKRFYETIFNIQYGLSDSPVGDDGKPWSLIVPK